jgi:peptidoglycan biosynthesis protein MviN/MurJ (putative lipid II flippase)
MSGIGIEHYRNLLIMAALSFTLMYILMYSIVNTIGNVLNNLNQFYMPELMTAPMVLIELFVMRSMYQNKGCNALITVASVIAGLMFFLLIRQQAAIADKQFLRSMIPHHAGAILMVSKPLYRIHRLRHYAGPSSQASRQRLIK